MPAFRQRRPLARGMLNRLAPAAHGLGILIQPLLHLNDRDGRLDIAEGLAMNAPNLTPVCDVDEVYSHLKNQNG